jgi:glycosyltransferase involved in cell wall biosynthesis
VTFLGAVSDERLRLLYQECDVFAMPSKGEGFGIVFLEAMHQGKPCIGGNHGGTPEVIDHGANGYLVDYGDVEQLAHYLMELFRKTDLRWNMGLKGYQKVEARYLFSHMRNNWFGLLEETLGRLDRSGDARASVSKVEIDGD